MRSRLIIAPVLLLAAWHTSASAQCAPAPDSPYFFKGLAEQRAEAKIAGTRAFYEELLSAAFTTPSPDGKSIDRRAYIDSELAAAHAAAGKPFFAIRDFTLIEHRKGFVVTNYRLIEGTTGGTDSHAKESWMREVYEVEDGKWRLASVDHAPPPASE